MTLTAAEHTRVNRETKARRNAAARRRRDERRCAPWLERNLAEWRCDRIAGGFVIYTLKVPGFSRAYANTLPRAIDALERTIAHWCASGATHGPTGASLAPLRQARGAASGE